MISPGSGVRAEMAISLGLTARVESCLESIASPTIFRPQAPRTAEQKTFPSLVACSVLSVNQNSFTSRRWDPVDEIIRGCDALQSFHMLKTWKISDFRVCHQHRDRSA